MTTEAIRERLAALAYDVSTDNAYKWALVWFRHRNGLQQSVGIDDALTDCLFSEKAIPGVGEGFPYYSMEDPLWADYPYDAANTSDRETVSTSGCGPTSMAMCVSHLLRRAVLPPVLCDWSNAHGHRDPDGQDGTYGTFFPACAELFGLHAEVHEAVGEASFAAIAQALSEGKCVISTLLAGSPFTKCGHYATIQGFEDGRVIHLDPVPRKNALPRYTLKEWLAGGWLREYIVVSHRK